MDSTKKATKKLVGEAHNTSSWATNVGNEHGQVLMSVLTSAEGCGLIEMASGLMKRYADAGVSPPKVLYVDRGCCGREYTSLRKLFKQWPEMLIRLDIWHCMKRFSQGCTTESHQLYAEFMGRLSKCFFILSEEDSSRLMEAKRCEMVTEGVPSPSENDVIRRVTKREIALHCRRRTREPQDIKSLVYDLIKIFAGSQGRATLGVPLLDSSRIWQIWEKEEKHLVCVTDPEEMPLYV